MPDDDQFDPLEFELPDDDDAQFKLPDEDEQEADAVPEIDLDADTAEPGETVEEVAVDEEVEVVEEVEEEAETEEVEPVVAKSKVAKPRAKKEKKAGGKGASTILFYAFLAVAIVVLVGLNIYVLGKGSFIFLVFMNVLALTLLAIPVFMWLGRKSLNVYEVVLGLALAAIVVSISCLLIEISRYAGEIKASAVSRAPAIEAPVQSSGPLNTNAVA